MKWLGYISHNHILILTTRENCGQALALISAKKHTQLCRAQTLRVRHESVAWVKGFPRHNSFIFMYLVPYSSFGTFK